MSCCPTTVDYRALLAERNAAAAAGDLDAVAVIDADTGGADVLARRAERQRLTEAANTVGSGS